MSESELDEIIALRDWYRRLHYVEEELVRFFKFFDKIQNTGDEWKIAPQVSYLSSLVEQKAKEVYVKNLNQSVEKAEH